jgi:hypothetical protein
MSDIMGGYPMIGQQALPPEVKKKMEDDTKRQCRTVAINTLNFLVEKEVVKFTVGSASDPNMTILGEYQTLAGKLARWVENGDSIS